MMRRCAAAIAALGMLSGCMSTPVAKLAKCRGPYRYANIYGTVLPSLPISGQPIPPQAQPQSSPPPDEPNPAGTAAPGSAVPQPGTSAPPQPDKPDQTSAIAPHYPSC